MRKSYSSSFDHFVTSRISSFGMKEYLPEFSNFERSITSIYLSQLIESINLWNPLVSYLLFMSHAVSNIIVR
jgi:hypothetical protein